MTTQQVWLTSAGVRQAEGLSSKQLTRAPGRAEDHLPRIEGRRRHRGRTPLKEKRWLTHAASTSRQG